MDISSSKVKVDPQFHLKSYSRDDKMRLNQHHEYSSDFSGLRTIRERANPDLTCVDLANAACLALISLTRA